MKQVGLVCRLYINSDLKIKLRAQNVIGNVSSAFPIGILVAGLEIFGNKQACVSQNSRKRFGPEKLFHVQAIYQNRFNFRSF